MVSDKKRHRRFCRVWQALIRATDTKVLGNKKRPNGRFFMDTGSIDLTHFEHRYLSIPLFRVADHRYMYN